MYSLIALVVFLSASTLGKKSSIKAKPLLFSFCTDKKSVGKAIASTPTFRNISIDRGICRADVTSNILLIPFLARISLVLIALSRVLKDCDSWIMALEGTPINSAIAAMSSDSGFPPSPSHSARPPVTITKGALPCL